jgi:ribokinase
MADVIVVGSYNAGLTIYSDRLPERGETVIGTRFDSGPGGKGANQAIGAKRLGADVLFVTKIGRDAFGDEARARLIGEGLPASGILASPTSTGVAMIFVDAAGDNAISVAPGANLDLRADDVIAKFERELAAARFLLLQLECSAELAVELGAWARARGIYTILNPAPARTILPAAFGSFDAITPNETELMALARTAAITETGVEAVAKALVALGIPNVIVTLAEEGALWVSDEGARHFPAYPVEAIDATGAGDAFNAALVAALSAGELFDAAIEQGCRAGAYCVTRNGVIDGLPTKLQLQAQSPTVSHAEKPVTAPLR